MDKPQPPTGPFATQPVITVTTITTAVAAIIGVLVTFGLPVSDEAAHRIDGAIIALWPIGTAAWTWYKVYAPATVQKVANRAHAAGKTGQAPPKVP